LRSSEVEEMKTMGAWAMTGFDFSAVGGGLERRGPLVPTHGSARGWAVIRMGAMVVRNLCEFKTRASAPPDLYSLYS